MIRMWVAIADGDDDDDVMGSESSNCQPSLMRCPEYGTEVGVRYGKSNHRNHISDQEKHHLHHWEI